MATLLGLVAGAFLAAASPADVPLKARDVLASPEYQTDIPGDLAPPPIEREREPRRRRLSPPLLIPAFVANAVYVLLWLSIAAVLCIVAVALYRNLRPPPVLDGPIRVDPGRAPAGPRPHIPPGLDPEALAQAARFPEAIHAMLLISIDAVARFARWSPAWTSREILRAPGLPTNARTPLGDLVSAAEACHFGTSQPGPEEYGRCRARYEEFRGAVERKAR
ncbi:MAG: hypothetical protein AAB215_04520 [Planctomycetota bacterium]